MSHIAGQRPRRALVPGVAIAVTITTGAFVEPVLAQDAAVFADVDRTMENYRLDAHIPGMVWGIVQDGRLVHVKGAGVQDIDTKRPVNADTLFRIASMTKAFTALSILKLGTRASSRSMHPSKRTCRSCAGGSTRRTTRRRFACASC